MYIKLYKFLINLYKPNGENGQRPGVLWSWCKTRQNVKSKAICYKINKFVKFV